MLLAVSRTLEIALVIVGTSPVWGAGIAVVYLGIGWLDDKLGRVAAVLVVLILVAAVVALFASGWVADLFNGSGGGGGSGSCVPDPRAGTICD